MRSTRASLVLAVLVIALMSATTASAYVRYSHKLKYGVGNYGANDQHYHIASSASTYASTIDSAMHDWIYTTSRLGITTPISYTKTSVQENSRMDLHAGNYYSASTGYIATTTWWNQSTQANPSATDWVWGKIQLNIPVYGTLSSTNKKGSTAHEMGHVMGLGENNTRTNSVMCQLGAGRTVSSAQADDCNGINAIY